MEAVILFFFLGIIFCEWFCCSYLPQNNINNYEDKNNNNEYNIDENKNDKSRYEYDIITLKDGSKAIIKDDKVIILEDNN